MGRSMGLVRKLLDCLHMIADIVEFLPDALVAVIYVVLAAEISDDRACLDRVAALEARLTSAAVSVFQRTLNNMVFLFIPAAWRVMSVMVTDGPRLEV